MQKCYFILLMYLACTLAGKAQNNERAFENFTTAQGLAQNDVHAIHQDARGYLWFGTNNGMSRYDGYEFITYKNIPKNPNSLLDNHIVSITSDKQYNLWVLTMKGLNKIHLPTGKYTHFPTQKDKNCQYIGAIDAEFSRIFADSQGRIWISCGCEISGAVYLDPKTNTIKPIKSNYSWNLDITTTRNHNTGGDFWEDSQGEIYMGFTHLNTKEGIAEYMLHNPEIKDTTQIMGINPDEHKNLRDKPKMPALDVLAFIGTNATAIDRYGNLWTGDQVGRVMCFSPTTKRLYYYPQWVGEAKNMRTAKHNAYATVKALHIDNEKNLLYIGLYGSGDVIVVDLEAEHAENQKQVLDKFGRVLRYGFAKKEVWHHNPSNPKSLGTSGSCIKVFTDKSACIWVSITGKGVYKYAPYKSKFELFATLPRDTTTIQNNDILTFLRTKQGIFFVGTSKGMYEYIEADNRFAYRPLYFTREGRQGEVRRITKIIEDNNGNLLIGTWGLGTYKYNPKTKQGYCLKYDKVKEEFNQPLAWVASLYYDEAEDKVWEFDWGSGKGYIDLKTEKAQTHQDYVQALEKAGKPIPKDKQQLWGLSRCFLRTKEGKFWIGSDREQPLTLFNPANYYHDYIFYPKDHPDSLKSTTVMCMLQDRKGRVWAGTANGLGLLNEAKSTWKTYNIPHGIPNENINGILEDEQGFLWLLTGQGLAKFDTEKEKVVLVLRATDGLPNEELTSAYQDSKENFYVGTANGFVRFNPEKLTFNTQKPRILLTHCEVKDKKLNTDSLIFLGDKCQFNRFDNDIEFTLASTDFNLPTQNKFRVKLEGYNTDWVVHGTRNLITYTNLPAGYYTLKVQASNNDGLWSEETVLLKFQILPAWYETWWAKAIAVLLLALLVWLIFRQRIRYLEAQKRNLESKVAEQTAELTEKNEELNQQNEEILQQRDNLEAINEELKQQQEEIQAVNEDLADKNHQIEQSIDAAYLIQQAMLPTQQYLAETFGKENYFVIYKPQQSKVSGDFYFLEEKRVMQTDTQMYENCLYFVCADCTGHGIPGALMTMLGNELLHEIIHNNKVKLKDPAKILRRLHSEIRRALQYKTTKAYNGMDLSMVILHKAKTQQQDALTVSKIEFAGAKNGILYIQNTENASLIEVKGDKKGIGGQEINENEGVREFETYTLPIEDKQTYTLYFYSDGYHDQLGGSKNKTFGSKKLRELLQENYTKTMQEQTDILEATHQQWKEQGHEIQTDDITLVALRVNASIGEQS